MDCKTSCLVDSIKCHCPDLCDLNTPLNVFRTLLSLLVSLLFYLAFVLPLYLTSQILLSIRLTAGVSGFPCSCLICHDSSFGQRDDVHRPPTTWTITLQAKQDPCLTPGLYNRLTKTQSHRDIKQERADLLKVKPVGSGVRIFKFYGSGWLSKFSRGVLAQKYIYDKIFVKIWSVFSQRYEPNCGIIMKVA